MAHISSAPPAPLIALHDLRAQLDLCRNEIKRQETMNEEKKDKERQRLQKIRIENSKEREVRSLRARHEADEDQRLMNEYKAKLDKEESDRASAFARRMARLEQFTNKSGEAGGAGFEQARQERELELIVLKEAAKKEAADIERERSDREKLRMNKVRMAMENKRIMEEKKKILDSDAEYEKEYANRFRREGEEYMREEQERFAENRQKMKKHQQLLTEQIDYQQNQEKNIEMSERERAMNKSMLLKVAGDKDLMAKIKAKLTAGQMNKAQSAPSIIGFGA